MRGRPPSAALRDLPHVLEAVRSGVIHSEIAARYGVHRTTITKIAARHGVPSKLGRPPAWPDCPPPLRGAYRLLRRKGQYRADEARAILERAR